MNAKIGHAGDEGPWGFPCEGASLTHDPVFEFMYGGGSVCVRCGHRTGNEVQGHYWTWCHESQSHRRYHHCCPGDCELAGAPRPRRVLTARPGHLVTECPNLADCAAHTEWYESWQERNA